MAFYYWLKQYELLKKWKITSAVTTLKFIRIETCKCVKRCNSIISKSVLKNNFETGWSPEKRDWMPNVDVRRESRTRVVPEVEPLQERGHEDEELLLRQRLAEAEALPDSERNNFIVRNKLSIWKQKIIVIRVLLNRAFLFKHCRCSF